MVIREVMYYPKADREDCGTLEMCGVNSKSVTCTFKKNYKVKKEKEQKILSNKIIDSKRQGDKEKTDETKKQLLNHTDNCVTFHSSGFGPASEARGRQVG